LEACNKLIERKVSMCDGKKLSKQNNKMASHLCLTSSYGCWLLVAGGGASKFELWAEISQGGMGGT
jgi:hypothetical protein